MEQHGQELEKWLVRDHSLNVTGHVPINPMRVSSVSMDQFMVVRQRAVEEAVKGIVCTTSPEAVTT